MPTGAGEPADHFSLVAGGPFHSVLQRVGLIGEDRLPKWQAAIGLALLAWLLPALLAVAQSLLGGSYSGWGYFTDLTVYARYLVAIAVMIGTERHADGRLAMLARQFREAKLIREDGLPGFAIALADSDRRASSALVEGALAVAALVWSGLTARFTVDLAGSSWEGTAVAGAVELSWAGEAARWLSNPLFLFLVLRWIWRFLLWSHLLFRISRLPLQLTPLHPDRSAGLGFLAIYPSIFNGFLFALSAVVASSLLKDLSVAEHSSQSIWFAVAGWLAFCLVLFVGPLVVFARPIYMERERAMLEYGRLAMQHHLDFHRKWISPATGDEEILGSPDFSSATDLNTSVEVVREIRIVPVDGTAMMQLLSAAGIPMLAVATTQVPLAELLKWIAGAIF